MKTRIIRLLKNNNNFLSGENISDKFGVSRSTIWKYINVLKEEGYEIESASRKGYKLVSSPDILTLEEVEEYLDTKFIGRNISYFHTLDSTNIKAQEIAQDAKEGTIIIAEEQIEGKGRLGRGWVSPNGKGIWMSVILKPSVDPVKVARITLMGAVAVNQALKAIGIKSGIKWPNDIIVDGKKLCGILTEMSCELNMINYVIMGIGINVDFDREDFNSKIADKAISLKQCAGTEINRKKLLAYVLNNLEKLYIPFKENGDVSRIIKISKQESIIMGKEVRIINPNTERVGKVLDIGQEGQLIIKYKDGRIEEVFSGEVSIRGINKYI